MVIALTFFCGKRVHPHSTQCLVTRGYKVPYNLIFFPTPNILIFFPKMSIPSLFSPLYSLPSSLNIIRKMFPLSPFPFFHVIFFPKAMIFPSPLYNLIFFPNSLNNFPPPRKGGGIRNITHPCLVRIAVRLHGTLLLLGKRRHQLKNILSACSIL